MPTKTMYDKIISLIDNYLSYGNIYMEVLEDGFYTEKSLEEELTELFKEYNYTTNKFSVDIDMVFESCSLDIFVIYVAYIDKNGKLEVISEILNRY